VLASAFGVRQPLRLRGAPKRKETLDRCKSISRPCTQRPNADETHVHRLVGGDFRISINVLSKCTLCPVVFSSKHIPDHKRCGLRVSDTSSAAQPVSQGVESERTVRLSIEIGGSGPFNFQWRKGAGPMPDGTNASFTIESASMVNLFLLCSSAALARIRGQILRFLLTTWRASGCIRP